MFELEIKMAEPEEKEKKFAVLMSITMDGTERFSGTLHRYSETVRVNRFETIEDATAFYDGIENKILDAHKSGK